MDTDTKLRRMKRSLQWFRVVYLIPVVIFLPMYLRSVMENRGQTGIGGLSGALMTGLIIMGWMLSMLAAAIIHGISLSITRRKYKKVIQVNGESEQSLATKHAIKRSNQLFLFVFILTFLIATFPVLLDILNR